MNHIQTSCSTYFGFYLHNKKSRVPAKTMQVNIYYNYFMHGILKQNTLYLFFVNVQLYYNLYHNIL